MAKDDGIDGENEISASMTSIIWNIRENAIHLQYKKNQGNQKIMAE